MNSAYIFNATNHVALYAGICTTAAISVIGCLIITITYWLMPELRRPPYPIIHRIALSDLLTSLFLLIAYLLAYFTLDKDVTQYQGVFYGLWIVVAIGEFGSLCFHGLLSINLLINSISPFADGSVLRKYFGLIYAFCIIYPIMRLTVWRIIYYGSLEVSRQSELPWEGAIGITLIFFLDLLSLALALYNVRSLDRRLIETKRSILIQMGLYLIVFVICYLGPLIFRIQYLISKDAENPHNPLFIWSQISELLTGFLNSLVWLAMPTIRNAVAYKFFHRKKTPESKSLLNNSVDKDFSQLYMLLRKNLLVTTLMGIRSMVATYTPAEIESQSDNLLNTNSDDFSTVEIPTMINSHEYDDEDLLMGTSMRFKTLGPKFFLNIAKISGFSPKYLYESLHPRDFLRDAMKNQKFSEGKSGSFFVFSPDKRLIIKTIPKSEFLSLERLLPSYYNHLVKYPNSLLIRLLGAYRVTLGNTEVFVLVMANLFTHPVEYKYDIKGSWVDRKADPSSSVKKDNDLRNDFLVPVDSVNISPFIHQIEKDTQLLADHNIMDYSLLLGFNKNPISSDILVRDESSELRSWEDDGQDYIMGIIDILQDYNFTKKGEFLLKVYGKCKDSEGLSAIPPEDYQTRFVNRMKRLFGFTNPLSDS